MAMEKGNLVLPSVPSLYEVNQNANTCGIFGCYFRKESMVLVLAAMPKHKIETGDWIGLKRHCNTQN